MKAIASLVVAVAAVAALLSACAPAAGRPTVQYRAKAPELLAAIADIGVHMQPSTSYNYYSVQQISDHSVRLRAETVTGISLVFGRHVTVVTFSASQDGDVATLAASSNDELGNHTIDTILTKLDARYQRVVPAF
ncbi:MAG: hypothetical protein P8Z81_14550 [Deinococcales bacterium]|jgi:hypothetical protein